MSFGKSTLARYGFTPTPPSVLVLNKVMLYCLMCNTDLCFYYEGWMVKF